MKVVLTIEVRPSAGSVKTHSMKSRESWDAERVSSAITRARSIVSGVNQVHDGLEGYDQEVCLEVFGQGSGCGPQDGFGVLWVFKMENGRIVLSAERPRYIGLDTSYKVVSAGATPQQAKRRARMAGTSAPLVARADTVAWVHLASHA